jgi:predicted alpha/beta hydrolase family esterase
MISWIGTTMLIAAAVVVLIMMVVWVTERVFPDHALSRSLLYAPPTASTYSWRQEGVTTEYGGGPSLVRGDPKATNVLVCMHGRACDAGWMDQKIRDDLPPNWRVVSLEFPGFGALKDEVPSEEAFVATAADALEAARRKHSRVVALGHSLGAAALLLACADELQDSAQPDAVVLVSPVPSVRAVAHEAIGPLSLLVQDRFRATGAAHRLARRASEGGVVPEFRVYHGASDPVVAPSAARRVASTLGVRFRLLANYGHVDMPFDRIARSMMQEGGSPP